MVDVYNEHSYVCLQFIFDLNTLHNISNHSLLAMCCHLSPVCVRCVGTQRRLHHLLEAFWLLHPDESVVGQQRQDLSQSVFEGAKAQLYKTKKDKLMNI